MIYTTVDNLVHITKMCSLWCLLGACILSVIFSLNSLKEFRKKYKIFKWIWISYAIIVGLCLMILLPNMDGYEGSHHNDSGYWDSDGYYNPKDKEMDQYIRDAKEWIDNN